MPQHLYDNRGNYVGSMLSDDEHAQATLALGKAVVTLFATLFAISTVLMLLSILGFGIVSAIPFIERYAKFAANALPTPYKNLNLAIVTAIILSLAWFASKVGLARLAFMVVGKTLRFMANAYYLGISIVCGLVIRISCPLIFLLVAVNGLLHTIIWLFADDSGKTLELGINTTYLSGIGAIALGTVAVLGIIRIVKMSRKHELRLAVEELSQFGVGICTLLLVQLILIGIEMRAFSIDNLTMTLALSLVSLFLLSCVAFLIPGATKSLFQ